MKQTVCTFCLAALFLLIGPAVAEEVGQASKGPVETFLDGCQVELEKYCKEVTPGEGRLVACIFAYEDKLSSRCEYALYDSAAQLDRAVSAITYVANECEEDLAKYCAKVQQVGEGQLLACLGKHENKVSGRCLQALKDVGLKE